MLAKKETLKYYCPLAICYVILLLLSMLIEPMEDDWFILKYFDGIANWKMTGPYHWVNDSILLPRGYWRPIEDVMLTLQTHFPQSFPYVNHFAAVTCAFIAIAVICHLGQNKLSVPPKIMGWTAALGMLMANNMGAIFSIDSITQTSCTMFTVISIAFFCSNMKAGWRYTLWLLACVMACLSKESGVCSFVLAPLFKMVCDFSSHAYPTVKATLTKTLKWVMIALIPSICYLTVYRTLSAEWEKDEDKTAAIELAKTESEQSAMELITTSQNSHTLTPVTFAKNVFIEYVAGIYPVDTSAVYYKTYWSLILTAILGLGGVALLFLLFKSNRGEYGARFWALLFVTVCSTAPAMVTRAGEISPFFSNVYLILLIATLVPTTLKKKGFAICLFLWLGATLITDAHKFSLAFINGKQTREMARAIASKTPSSAEKVLWLGPDEFNLDRAGAAFNKNPYRGFLQGAAVIRELDWQRPESVDVRKIAMTDWNEQLRDSIVAAELPHYDCIWITQGTRTEVVVKP